MCYHARSWRISGLTGVMFNVGTPTKGSSAKHPEGATRMDGNEMKVCQVWTAVP